MEKTSTFLGYSSWKELLPDEARDAYYNRIINFNSHSRHSGEETSIIEENDKKVLRYLVSDLEASYKFKQNTLEENGTV